MFVTKFFFTEKSNNGINKMSLSLCFRYTRSQFPNTMMLMSVLVSLLFVAMAKCHPISYNTYDERELSRDHPPLLLLVDHRIPDLEVWETSLPSSRSLKFHQVIITTRIKKWNICRVIAHIFLLIVAFNADFHLFSILFSISRSYQSPARINKTRIQILKVNWI